MVDYLYHYNGDCVRYQLILRLLPCFMLLLLLWFYSQGSRNANGTKYIPVFVYFRTLISRDSDDIYMIWVAYRWLGGMSPILGNWFSQLSLLVTRIALIVLNQRRMPRQEAQPTSFMGYHDVAKDSQQSLMHFIEYYRSIFLLL